MAALDSSAPLVRNPGSASGSQKLPRPALFGSRGWPRSFPVAACTAAAYSAVNAIRPDTLNISTLTSRNRLLAKNPVSMGIILRAALSIRINASVIAFSAFGPAMLSMIRLIRVWTSLIPLTGIRSPLRNLERQRTRTFPNR
ncbi:hypothetical protein D3C84_1014510 [compost metagenome]